MTKDTKDKRCWEGGKGEGGVQGQTRCVAERVETDKDGGGSTSDTQGFCLGHEALWAANVDEV